MANRTRSGSIASSYRKSPTTRSCWPGLAACVVYRRHRLMSQDFPGRGQVGGVGSGAGGHHASLPGMYCWCWPARMTRCRPRERPRIPCRGAIQRCAPELACTPCTLHLAPEAGAGAAPAMDRCPALIVAAEQDVPRCSFASWSVDVDDCHCGLGFAVDAGWMAACQAGVGLNELPGRQCWCYPGVDPCCIAA